MVPHVQDPELRHQQATSQLLKKRIHHRTNTFETTNWTNAELPFYIIYYLPSTTSIKESISRIALVNTRVKPENSESCARKEEEVADPDSQVTDILISVV
jgi:hypothetical protein